MKLLLISLFFFIAFLGYNQSSGVITVKKNKIELIGIWILTDFNNPDKFRDTWQFTSDSIFRELKYKEGGDTTLVPDENGTWKLKEEKLTITVTGEKNSKGKEVKYSEPQTIEFILSQHKNELILEGEMNKKAFKLKLTKK